jgi:hypothetical protein
MCLRNSPTVRPTESSEAWPRPWVWRGAALLLGASLAACASGTVDHARLRQARAVAVVGFSAHLDLPEASGPKVAAAGVGWAVGPGGAARSAEAAQATALYEGLRAALREGLGWSVLSRPELLARPAFAAVLQAQGAVERGLLARSDRYVHPEGVLWEIKARALTLEERERLLEGLGVDLLVVAQVHLTPEEGDATRAVAQVELLAYAAGAADPVWHHRGPVGPAAATPEAAALEAYRRAAEEAR